MIRKFCAVLAVVAVVAFVASPAEAGGGGGSKKSVTMKVRNAQAATETGVPVIYLATGAVPPTPETFFSSGGKVVNPGQTVNFLVAPGTGTAQTITSAGAPGGSAGYTAVNGKVGNAVIEGTAADPTIRGL